MTDLNRLKGPMAAPASGRDPLSLVILLHGYGSNGDDLMGLVPYWRASLPDRCHRSVGGPTSAVGPPASTSANRAAAGASDAAP